METRPASAAISAQSPTRPMWPAVLQGHQREADAPCISRCRWRRPADRPSGRSRAASIHHGQHRCLGQHFYRLIGDDDAVPLPLQVTRNARHAVAVVARQVGGDQVFADARLSAAEHPDLAKISRTNSLSAAALIVTIARPFLSLGLKGPFHHKRGSPPSHGPERRAALISGGRRASQGSAARRSSSGGAGRGAPRPRDLRRARCSLRGWPSPPPLRASSGARHKSRATGSSPWPSKPPPRRPRRERKRGAACPKRQTKPRKGAGGRATHDVGGLTFGAIDRSEHDLALWEKRTDAMQRLLTRPGNRAFTVDGLRRVIERLWRAGLRPHHLL